MAVVCSNTGGGRLVAIETGQAIPLVLSLRYLDVPSTPPQTTLIKLGVATAVVAEQGIAAQFQKAMDDVVYVTPFGDEVGVIAITFIANRQCGDASATNGFDVIQHYLDRRLLPTSLSRLPATIIIGSGAFNGFLVGLAFKGQSGDLPLTEGTLQFKAWPA
jgi:hypothetical protein